MGEGDNEGFHSMSNSSQGGRGATIFIYLFIGFDSIGFVSNMVSLVLYFLFVMHFDLSGSSTTLTNFLGATFLLTLVGGFISDTYMNRLNTCLLFGVLQLLGYLLMIIQSHYTNLQPDPCIDSKCIDGGKALMLYASLGLLAIGGGGIRGSLPSLGADQFDQRNPDEHRYLARFFNWFLLSTTIGAIIGTTVVVWLSTKKSWDKGFITSMICSFAGLIILACGKSFYRVRIPGESCLSRIFQVLVVALKNRKEQIPENPDALYEIRDQESAFIESLIKHTDQFRLLDKAAIIPEGSKPGKWRVCTITQVEEVKILTRMMPIILSTILMNTCLAQLQTFSVQQGTIMNPNMGSFKFPTASIPVLPLIFMSILIPVYEFVFVPIIRKVTGHPNGITHLQRVGVGLVLAVISMSIAGVLEVRRKREFLNHGNRISVFWLGVQYSVFGIADMFTLVGLLEFFYSEAPAGMKSLATSFTWLSMSIGYSLSSVFVELTNFVTSKVTESKRGWLEGRDLNKNRVELFYWFLAILNVLNFANYLYWAKWYSSKKEAIPMQLRKHQDPSFDQSQDIATDETAAMINERT